MRHFTTAAAIVCVCSALLVAQSGPNDARAREIFKELIEINTTDTPNGNVTKAADAVAARLKAAGFPAADVQVLGPDPRKGNLVARLRGTGAKRPVLLLAHLDVVEAKREDWSMDPFTFAEKEGFFYGRGTSDDKSMASQFVANVIRLKEEGWKGERYGAFHDLVEWRRHLQAAGFVELEHYYRPPGLPREQQPWLASVWRCDDQRRFPAP